MQFEKILSVLAAIAGFAQAFPRDVESMELAGYNIVDPNFVGPVVPGGANVSLVGPIDYIISEILKINPNYREDFPAEASSTEAEVAARQNFNCGGRWGDVGDCDRQRSNIRDLPPNGEAVMDPGDCFRVGCSFNAGLQWCNDGGSRAVLPWPVLRDRFFDTVDNCDFQTGGNECAGQTFWGDSTNTISLQQNC